MFTTADLSELVREETDLAVSIFMPTHLRGREVRQDPIRLKNLVSDARSRLESTGMARVDVDEFVAPVLDLVDDYGFWQHQADGLAVYLTRDQLRHYKIPHALQEQVVVGSGFRISPLLPVLVGDEPYLVLTLTTDKVRLFEASRFTLNECDLGEIPASISAVAGEADYQNPVQASPIARPQTGSINISNAQVYGDSPPEWRKIQLTEFVRTVTVATERRLAGSSLPLVVVADAEIGGHFKKFASLGSNLAGVIAINPAGIDRDELHQRADEAVRERFDAHRLAAMERFASLRGKSDPRAATALEDVLPAAHQGRVDVLFIRETEALTGHFGSELETRVFGDDDSVSDKLAHEAVVQTLLHGAVVYPTLDWLDADGDGVAAILRY